MWIAGIWERSKLGALKLNRLENFRDISSQLSYAMFASSLFAVLDSQLALIMVGNLSGAAQAGLYSGAERFSLAASLVGQAIYMAIAQKSRNRIRLGMQNLFIDFLEIRRGMLV